MTAYSTDIPRPSTDRRAPLLPALTQLVKAELRRMFRNPMFAIGTIGFPILFFMLFGLPNIKEVTSAGVSVGQILLVSFGTYSMLSVAVFSFGAVVATERTGGWLRLLRASPVPVPLYFTARIIGALVFAFIGLSALYAAAHFTGGITFTLGMALSLAGKLLLGLVPLIAMGLMIGFLANPQAAQVLAQIVSVLMAFASGLFMPLDQLPHFVQKVAPFMPAYHLGQIGVNTVAGHTGGEWQHWLALAAFTLVFGTLAVWGMKKDESREG